MPSLVIEIVQKHWAEITENDRKIIARDVQEAISDGRDLGDSCDRVTWRNFANWIHEKSS